MMKYTIEIVKMQVSNIANNYLRSVTVTKEFDHPMEKIWETISKESNLELFHPFCKKNPTIAWEEDRHQDEIHYINGFILKREFVAWEKNIRSGLKVTHFKIRV